MTRQVRWWLFFFAYYHALRWCFPISCFWCWLLSLAPMSWCCMTACRLVVYWCRLYCSVKLGIFYCYLQYISCFAPAGKVREAHAEVDAKASAQLQELRIDNDSAKRLVARIKSSAIVVRRLVEEDSDMELFSLSNVRTKCHWAWSRDRNVNDIICFRCYAFFQLHIFNFLKCFINYLPRFKNKKK